MTEEIKQPEKQEEKPIKNGEKTDRDKKGRFVEGNPGGPGRSKGLRDFITDFNEAVEIVARETGLPESKIRTDLLVRGIGEARRGNFNFWNVIMERVYGKVAQPIEGDISVIGAQELANKLQSILDEDKPKAKKSDKGTSKDILQKPQR